MHWAIRLTGALNVPALERAVSELMARHEVLRCRIELVDGAPVQFAAAAAVLEIVDVSGEGASKRASETLAEWTERPFDLSRGPLIRLRLARLGDQEHVFAVTVHHIAADAWSVGVLQAELAALYRAFAAGEPSPLPELPLQYGDYAVWQREWLSGERLHSELKFWRQALAEAPSALELPLDRTRPRVASYRGSAVPFRVDASLTAALKRLAGHERATLFMVLLAAFEVLLVRWSGHEDVLVGVPTAGRVRREVEGLIGFFVNTLVMRLSASGNPTFAELVRRVRETALDVFDHQDLPFEALVEQLGPERDLGRNPLVQVSFQLVNKRGRQPDRVAGVEARLAGLSAEPFFTKDRTATHFDLSVIVTETAEGLLGEFTYATDLFDGDTIGRLAQSYLRVLRRAAEVPLHPVSALTLADPPETARAWAEGAGSARGADQTIGELFRRQAHRSPEAVAVVCEGQSLSYGELQSRANQLARHLRRLGVGPEVAVGLCLDRSLETVVAILAIIEAGGAYVPVDPGMPANRAALILDDAGASVVVTISRLAGRPGFPDEPGTTVVCLDRVQDQVSAEADVDLEQVALPDSLLSVMYTSGSTGRPNGVMVRHGHVARYVIGCLDELPCANGGAVPLTSSISFAGATLPLFGSLLSGRCLIVPDRDDQFSWCTSHDRYSFVKLSPSALRYAHDRFGPCWQGWGCVVLASEPVKPGDWELLRTAEGVTAFVDYGTTETNGSTLWQAAPGPGGRGLPIGLPLAPAQVLVLDRWGDIAPPGVPGEIFIGGSCVARGYVGRPGLTAERFVANPFGPPGSRLFRTGDRGRRAADGHLEFLGRADRQVKIRGYRVELDDVEHELLALDDTAGVAVTAGHDGSGAPALTAYVSVKPGRELSPADVRNELAQRIPGYMIPARLALVADLPRTPGGKIDRRALAAIAVPAVAGGDPPQTPAEHTMAEIWADVLHVGGLGRDDDFFALGGHSLLAMQILGRIGDAFGVDLSIQVIFEAPTIAALTRCVEQSRQKRDEDATEQLIEQLIQLPDEEVGRMLRMLDE